MGLTKLEKLVYVGCPWFFGIILVICGIVVSSMGKDTLIGMLLICSGLICMSLYCVSSLLAKVIEAKKE